MFLVTQLRSITFRGNLSLLPFALFAVTLGNLVVPCHRQCMWLVQAAGLAKLVGQLTTLPVISLSFSLRRTLLLSQLCPRNS